ncbi:MAG: YicC family protein [Muribaculaceae bacterium]
MLMSMTGFGKATVEVTNKRINIEIKSLNSKQMDLNVRVPHIFRQEELPLRSYATGILERGKADISVTIENTGSDIQAATTVNTSAMAAYKKQIEQTSAELGIAVPSDWYSVLMRFPDVLSNDNVAEADETEKEALMTCARNAIEQLMLHRRAEGAKLEEFFGQRIATIRELLAAIEPYERERIEKIRGRIEDGLSKIPVAEYDKGRLEQEMIFYIEKLDVNEEKQRLAQHLNYFMETMEAPAGQGKKLGFIAQEMGREINTLGSKSNHAEMQKIVVRMKDALEQIKEQVLNVM